MINQSLVEFEVQDGVANIQFNRPDSLNAASIDLAHSFYDAVEKATLMANCCCETSRCRCGCGYEYCASRRSGYCYR
jgi:hypothetical protein